MSLLRKVVAAFFALGISLGQPLVAQAQQVEYGVVTINNPTCNTLYYQFRWGECNQWVNYTLTPGCYRYHWCQLDACRKAPPPFIGFDNAQGCNHDYRLEFFAACQPCAQQGKWYVFRYSPCGTSLNLYGQ